MQYKWSDTVADNINRAINKFSADEVDTDRTLARSWVQAEEDPDLA
jgi:hypothetical protein